LNEAQFIHFQFASPDAYLLDMAAGDFNGDGKLDLAVLFFNAISGRFGIATVFGTGDGGLSLGPDTLLPIGTNPTSIAVGDFNGDGKADIAVTNFQENPNDDTLGVLFGNGDGSFAAPVSYKAGAHASFVATGSLRGDNHIDIIVANENFPGGVTVFLNDGNGGFTKSNTYFAGTNPVSIVVADLNGDGIADVAVANLNGDSVSVLFGHPDPNNPGHGDGTFMDTVAYVTGGFPTSIVAADFFNHADGRLDLITTDSASNDVSVVENIGPAPSPSPPGAGRVVPPSAGQDGVVSVLAPSDLDQLFLAMGAQEPASRSGQSEARLILDTWHALVRRRRMDNSQMFTTLLWEEN
jgi:hypothetical protein